MQRLRRLFSRSPEDTTMMPHRSASFPQFVPFYPVRSELGTHNPVSTGIIEHLEGLSDLDRRSLDEFKKFLHCAPEEPNLQASVSLMNVMTPSKDMIEMICTWAETECRPWRDCHGIRETFKQGRIKGHLTRLIGSPYQMRLVRIINSTLFLDWPWGIHRFQEPPESILMPIQYVLAMVDNLDDCVFFLGEEKALMPWDFAFAAFSSSPTLKNSDMPWPWPYSFKQALTRYTPIEYREWPDRIPKAAFAGHLTKYRQIFFNVALQHPDLIDAYWNGDPSELNPWNPLSKETKMPEDSSDPYYLRKPNASFPTGYLEPLLRSRITENVDIVGKYKYLVVLSGVYASADRLAGYLAYSGSVVLLQESDYSYHFSERLKPWVHYVPISYSGADVAEKVRWLQEHDDLAERIAHNALNFAKSYLRLEDYLCYAATALDAVAQSQKGSDALQPFTPRCIDQENSKCEKFVFPEPPTLSPAAVPYLDPLEVQMTFDVDHFLAVFGMSFTMSAVVLLVSIYVCWRFCCDCGEQPTTTASRSGSGRAASLRRRQTHSMDFTSAYNHFPVAATAREVPTER